VPPVTTTGLSAGASGTAGSSPSTTTRVVSPGRPVIVTGTAPFTSPPAESTPPASACT
jgi:hypothetical protein